jgi:prepilin-type N-terminal cleavage/methylation domain-containing protein
MKFFNQTLNVEKDATEKSGENSAGFRRLHRRAFTLIEIMVAIAIFAIVLAALYSTWIFILRSMQVSEQAAAQVQRRRIAVETIEDALTCVQSFQASMKYYTFIVQGGQSDNQSELSFTARVPDVFPRNGRFNSDLRRLTFTVEPAPDSEADAGRSEMDLVLRQNPILMDMDPDEKSTPLVLARYVKDFTVECWDTNQMQWDKNWDDTNSIPPLVRVTLKLGGKDSAFSQDTPTLSVTRLIAIPSETVPSILQTGAGIRR